MKRYLVFHGDVYYASGGWDDFIGSFDVLDEAIAAAPRSDFTWWHVVDTENEAGPRIVASGEEQALSYRRNGET